MTIALRIYNKAYNKLPLEYWNEGNQKTDIVFAEDDDQSLYDSAIDLVALDLLRGERNRKLAETDWWCASDRTPNKAQLDYRTALRNLPSTAKPKLDETGNLTGFEWPTKPSE
tara:strand:+ start:1329 stop:1667 length:339 start_codon:yes stop_codon:yes gene_type:complete